MHASLLKANMCEQRSQYDAALKIYQGLLRLVPGHPQVNGLKGALLIQMGRPAQAIQPHQPQDSRPNDGAGLPLQRHNAGLFAACSGAWRKT